MRRGAAAFLTIGLLGGVAGAATGERQARIHALSKQLGVEPQQLADPAAWERRNRKALEARAKEAEAALKAAPVPPGFAKEASEIDRQQSTHTLNGYLQGTPGSRPEITELPASVQDLYRSFSRTRVRPGLGLEIRDRGTIELGIGVSSMISPLGRPDFGRRIASGPSTLPPEPDAADRASTADAPSDHPLMVARAQSLGNDAVKIFNFVRDNIANEVYAGAKKGAIGTLRERAGNDYDQASLLIALLRAAGFAARYQVSAVVLGREQAEAYTGMKGLGPSATILGSAGVPIYLGPVGGPGLKMEHAWVRAYVPATAYRGVGRPGGAFGWVNLSPAMKAVTIQNAVDLRDVAFFDFNGYLQQRTNVRPSEVYMSQLRSYVQTRAIKCDTLEAAQPLAQIVPFDHPILPSELPMPKVSRVAFDEEWQGAEFISADVPATRRHTVQMRVLTSQGTPQLTFSAPMSSLWGKSVTVVYDPATAADASTIASYGGLENTPAYLIRLRPVLKVDGVPVAMGATAEAPGLFHPLFLTASSPMGPTPVEHNLTVGGVYAFVLDAGLIPEDMAGERTKRLGQLTGDDLAAEKLHITGVTYLREFGRTRQQLVGLAWHRLFKEVEEVMVALEPRVTQVRGIPTTVARAFFMLDAALIRSGNFATDGNDARRARVAKLAGYESSFLEHRAGELFYGPRQFSAVKLLQIANQGGVTVVEFTGDQTEDALLSVHWPQEFEDRMRDAANRGLIVKAPVNGHPEAGLGTFFGFVAVEPNFGAGEYIVAFEGGATRAFVHGGVGDAGPGPESGGPTAGCITCGGNAPAGSLVHLLTGNYVHQVTDLTLPARGIPLVFARTYSSQLGWHHNYDQHIDANPDGSLTYVDDTGAPRRFVADAGGTFWTPPPTLFQRIEPAIDGYRMLFKDGMVYRFSAAGKLLAQADLNGHQVTLTYAPSGKLASVAGAGGKTITLSYDSSGRLQTIADSAGRSVILGYDAAGNVADETDVLGKTRHYGYDGLGRMTAKTDFRANLTRLFYDDLGRMVRSEDAEEGVHTYAYDYRHNRTLHVDRAGSKTVFEINPDGQPTRIVDAVGNESVMQYDPRGNKTSEPDARANQTIYTYDTNGNVLTTNRPLQSPVTYTYGTHSRLATVADGAGTTSYAYDANGNLTSTTDPLFQTTTYIYEDGLPVQITRPGNSVTTMVYDGAGNVTSMTDGQQNQTGMTYDGAGHLTRIDGPGATHRTMTVDPRGQVRLMRDAFERETTFEYDDDGNRTQVVGPDLQPTNFSYDKLGRLTATTDALGNVTRQEYDGEGRVVARIDARGFRNEMRYDKLGRLVWSRDPLGNVTQMGYCAELAQQPCKIVDPLGNVTEVSEDELGREIQRRDPLGNAVFTAYDLLGRRQSVLDPAGNATFFGYDASGRLDRVTDALLNVTQYGYDGRGNRTAVVDANGHSTQFVYDRANRLTREVTPITTATDFGYDAAGNRSTKIDGKRQAGRFVYDANRRLTDIMYADGTSAHFEYDVTGNRTLEQNADGRRTMTYDELNRMATVTDVRTGRTISYTYDPTGNRASMKVMPDNEVTTYAWDSRGLLARMTDADGGVYYFTYDGAGRRRTTIYPNGMVLTIGYDAASRVVSMVYRKRSGDIIESFTYAYDNRGNRTAKIFADGGAEVYRYDALSRLMSVTYPTGRVVRYSYDAVGNRAEMLEGISVGSASSCAGDTDCDGVKNGADNCPTLANPDQTNSDASPQLTGLVAGFNLDEATGQQIVKDVTGRNDGEVPYGVAHVPGVYGNGLRAADSPVGYVARISPSPSLSGLGSNLTVSFWAKTNSGHPYGGTVLGKTNRLRVDLAPDRTMIIRTETIYANGAPVRAGFGAASSPVLVFDTWMHIGITVNGQRVRFYFNGAFVSETLMPLATSFGDNGYLFIGCAGHGDGTGNCGPYSGYSGSVDDVGIWDRALTDAEMLAVKNQPFRTVDRLGDACDACPTNSDSACAPATCLDRDGDGYGVRGSSSCSAGRPNAFDCADNDSTIQPGALELCDGADNDCNGRVDDNCIRDGQRTVYSYNAFNQLVALGSPRVCSGADVDCDGIRNNLDNCPFVANADQRNSDTRVVNARGTGARSVWGFDEGIGTTVADSVGGNTGTATDGVLWTNGFSGKALDLTAPRYVRLSSWPGLPIPFTMEAKVRVPSQDGGGVIIGWPNANWAFNNNSHHVYHAPPYSPIVQYNGPMPAERWVHAAVSYDGTKLRLYHDGQQVAEATTSYLDSDSGIAILGRFTGMIDELALWPRVLSTAELEEHRQSLFGDTLGDVCDPCVNNPDPACRPTTCTDVDGDGYGTQGASACPGGLDKFDCNDANGAVHPGVADMCDAVDNDCDGLVDEDCPAGQDSVTFQYDANGNMIAKSRPSGTAPPVVGDSLDQGRIAAWTFDESSATIAEDSAKKNPGQIVNAPHADTDWGRGMLFGTPNTYVTVADSPSFAASTDAMSMSLWIKPFSGPEGGTIIQKAGVFGIWRSGSEIWYGDSARSVKIGNVINNQWWHLAVSFGGGRVKTYVNGTLTNDLPRPGTNGVSQYPVLIGCNATSTTCYDVWWSWFQGIVDEVGIWSRALTTDEVTRLAAGSVYGTAPATLRSRLNAAWQFDETSGTEAADMAGTSPGKLEGPTHVAGRFGNALHFDGNDGIIVPNTPPTNLRFQVGMTIAGWVKPAPEMTVGTILYKRDQLFLLYSNGGIYLADSIRWAHDQELGRTTAGQWNHVAVVLGGGRLKTYINGQQTSDIPRAGMLQGFDIATAIGCSNYYGGSCQDTYFKGDIDELGLWSRALGADEVAALAAGPLNQPSAPSASGPPAMVTVTTFGYDARDRMMSAADAGIEMMSARYGTDNLRTSLKEGATERLVLLDGVEEHAEYDAANVNTKLARYDHDPSRVDGLLSQTVDGTKVYFVTDALGSVYAAVQADGTVVHKASYDAFGAKNTSVDASGTPWGFTGRRVDSGTGLMNYRERYLDATLGRFTQVDPERRTSALTSPGQRRGQLGITLLNTYGYVESRPTFFIDPEGKVPRFVNCSASMQKAYWDAIGYAVKAQDLPLKLTCKNCLTTLGAENGPGGDYATGGVGHSSGAIPMDPVLTKWEFMKLATGMLFHLETMECAPELRYTPAQSLWQWVTGQTPDERTACGLSYLGDTERIRVVENCGSPDAPCNKGLVLHESAHAVLSLPDGVTMRRVGHCACIDKY